MLTKTTTTAIVAIVATLAMMTVMTVVPYAQTAFAKASDNANPVAHGANTNQGYMEFCKQTQTARECATGPGNNGEFTSGLAHAVNGP
jgi:hypothetical protein